jgi:hypothetical protein
MTSSPYEQFAQRAHRYRCLDEQLATRTRFFAAAALTNSVLAELCVHPARWLWISCDSIVALAALGGRLERANLERVRHIRHDTRSSMWLDCSFIEMEQVLVESVLHGWAQSCAPRYHRFISELDRIFHAVAAGLPLRGSPDVRRYVRVLRSVTEKSGRYLSFASRNDRVRIGKALIQE